MSESGNVGQMGQSLERGQDKTKRLKIKDGAAGNLGSDLKLCCYQIGKSAKRVCSPTVSEGCLKEILIRFEDAIASSAEVAHAAARFALPRIASQITHLETAFTFFR
jgi:hypothetical protein